jgi:hypothetical protein
MCLSVAVSASGQRANRLAYPIAELKVKGMHEGRKKKKGEFVIQISNYKSGPCRSQAHTAKPSNRLLPGPGPRLAAACSHLPTAAWSVTGMQREQRGRTRSRPALHDNTARGARWRAPSGPG